jgi:hypothetical protein
MPNASAFGDCTANASNLDQQPAPKADHPFGVYMLDSYGHSDLGHGQDTTPV